MPELPVRFFSAVLRLIPRYVEYAGHRVADALLQELQLAMTESASYGTDLAHSAVHNVLNASLVAVGGPPVRDSSNPVVLITLWFFGAWMLKHFA